MKDLSDFQHYIGCDVSKNTLDFAIHERGADYRSFRHCQFPNTPEGCQAMRKWLRTFSINVRDCVIAMEHTGSYSVGLAEWCFKKGITFVFLHPMDVKSACSRGREKTDRTDAQFIADYVYTMREKLSPSEPEPQVIKHLRQLRNERQMAVRSRTAYINLAKSFPQGASSRRVEKLVAVLTAQIRDIETATKKEIASDERLSRNFALLLSVPGIGLVNALTTIIATGNFSRFQTARQYAKFSCVAPMAHRSGISVRSGDHVSHSGHSEIKSVLSEGARSAIRHDRQLRDYYQRKRLAGKSHGSVLNAIKFKLICRIFAVIRRQTPFVDLELFRGDTA